MLAEYEFEIRHLPGNKNVIADYSSRSLVLSMNTGDESMETIEVMLAKKEKVVTVKEEGAERPNEKNEVLEPRLEEVRLFLSTLYGTCTSVRVRQRPKKYALIGFGTLRRTMKGLRVVLEIQNRDKVLKALHDKAGHWQLKTMI